MAKEFKNVVLPYTLEFPGGYALKDGIDMTIKAEWKNVVANQGWAMALCTTKSINLSTPTGTIPLIFEVDYIKKEICLKTFGQKTLPSGCEMDPVGMAIIKKDSLTNWLPLQKQCDGCEITLRATETSLQVWIEGMGMFCAVTPMERVAWLHISDVKCGGALKIPSVIFKKGTPMPATEGGIPSATRTAIPSM